MQDNILRFGFINKTLLSLIRLYFITMNKAFKSRIRPSRHFWFSSIHYSDNSKRSLRKKKSLNICSLDNFFLILNQNSVQKLLIWILRVPVWALPLIPLASCNKSRPFSVIALKKWDYSAIHLYNLCVGYLLHASDQRSPTGEVLFKTCA